MGQSIHPPTTVPTDRTTRPGTTMVPDSQGGAMQAPTITIIRTPDGFPGFDGTREWVLERADDAVFGLLRNVDEPAIGLLVAEPWDLAPGYDPDLPDADLGRLEITAPEQVALFVVATIAPDRSSVWLNLTAPIAVNVETMQARQIILDRQGWPMRHPIALKG
jgi:flagellar assembly factor FliW